MISSPSWSVFPAGKTYQHAGMQTRRDTLARWHACILKHQGGTRAGPVPDHAQTQAQAQTHAQTQTYKSSIEAF